MPRKSASSPFNAYRKQAYDNIATAHQDRIPDLLDVKEELKRITPPGRPRDVECRADRQRGLGCNGE